MRGAARVWLGLALPLLVGAAAIGCSGSPPLRGPVDAQADAFFQRDLGVASEPPPWPWPVADGAWDVAWEHACALSCGIVETARDGDSCRFLIHCPAEEGDFLRVAVSADGQLVPRDRSRSQGWDFNDASNSAIELYGQICAALMNGTVTAVAVSYFCTTP